MSAPVLSYTKKVYRQTYEDIDPTLSGLSTEGKVVLITGASGDIGRATAVAFAASRPKALVLLGRSEEKLQETKKSVEASQKAVTLKLYTADLCIDKDTFEIFEEVKKTFGHIDVLVHCAGILPTVVPLAKANPTTFIDGYKTTIVGTLVTAQAFLRVNETAQEAYQKKLENFQELDTALKTAKESSEAETAQLEQLKKQCQEAKQALRHKDITFINVTTAGIVYPPFHGMGAYVSSKMAAVKLLECFAAENKCVRLHNVHPGFLRTAMSEKLSKTMQLPFKYDDISLTSDFLVWIASPEAEFLDGRLVFAAWDVKQLKARQNFIIGEKPGTEELCLGFKGFPRYENGILLDGLKEESEAEKQIETTS
ncbi:putative secondary metabolism biosynthetic enzyme [Trichoderma virens FT-333]|nr:putative secondary metabolism biosynthetic enzyme [Trichoderma virens FT-333]